MQNQGLARVIVRRRLPAGVHIPEGDLPSPAAVVLQRSQIASVQSHVIARLARTTHRTFSQYGIVPLLSLEIGPAALVELEGLPGHVEAVSEDRLSTPALPRSVPLIGGDQAWASGYDRTGTVVAILDTEVDQAHPFLAGKVIEEACYSSTVAGRSTTLCPNGLDQQTGPGAGINCSLGGCWDGAHVAGIAAGNGYGAGQPFSGVAKGARIMAVQVFSRFETAADCGGSSPCIAAWESDLIAGLEQAYTLRAVHNLAAANMRLGGGIEASTCDSDPMKPIIDNLRSVGIATVIASGNGGSTNSISFPACISSAVSVTSTTKADVVSLFPNVASFLSFLAPRESITSSSVPGGGFAGASGTSMATPHVTGAWVVLKQAVPNATANDILTDLQLTGLAITDTRSGGTITKPRIRIFEALTALGPGISVTGASPPGDAQGATLPVTVSGASFQAGASASFGPGITVTTTAVPAATQLTASLAIAATPALGPRDVTVTNPGRASATLPGGFTVVPPPPPTPTLTKAGSGTGTVTSSPGGITCGATCTASFPATTVVTLTATPDANSSFTGWSEDADCADGSVTMTGNVGCAATFALPGALVAVAVDHPEDANRAWHNARKGNDQA